MQADPSSLLADYHDSPDRAHLRRLLEGIQDRVFAVCLEILRHRQDAEDAAQEAILEICRGLDEVREPSRFGSWVYRVAFHTALDGRRRRMVRSRHERAKVLATSEVWVEPDDVRLEIHEALARLDDDARELLAEHYFAGTSLAAIARARGVSTNAVWKRMERCRARLRDELESAGHGAVLPALLGYLEQIEPCSAPPTLIDGPLLDAACRALPTSLTTAGGVFIMVKSSSLGIAAVVVALVVGAVWLGRGGAPVDPQRAGSNAGPPRVAESPSAGDGTFSAAPPMVPGGERDRTPVVPAGPSLARLVGRVQDASGQPVRDVAVELLHGERDTRTTRTDDSGEFGFGFASRTPVISILARAGEQTIECYRALGWMLTPGDTEEVILEVGTGGRVRGVVLDEQDRPVPDVEVQAYVGEGIRRLDEPPQRVTRTDGQGGFELGAVGERFTLMAERPGYACVQRYSGRLGEGEEFDDATLVIHPAWTLRGRILDPAGAPIADARVMLEPDRFLTDDDVRGVPIHPDLPPSRFATTQGDGSFECPGLARETYRLDLRVPGYCPVSIEVPADREALDVVLDPGVQLELRVCDRSGRPIASARAWSTRSPNDPIATDENGRGMIVGLEGTGRTTIVVRSSDHAVGVQEVDLESGPVEVVLDAGLTIAGSFVDAVGEPIPHARVTIEGSRKIGQRFPQDVLRLARIDATVTDRLGRFRFAELAEGSYRVTAAAPGEGAPLQIAELEAGDTEARIVFDPRPVDRAHLAGRVVDAITGEAIEHLRLTAIKNSGPGTAGAGSTHDLEAPGGEFELVGLEPGYWQFEMKATGYASTWRPTAEYLAGDHRVDFALDPTCTVHLRVIDERGAPFAGGRIEFRTPEGFGLRPTPTPRNPNGEVILDERGESVVEGLPRKSLVIRALRGDEVAGTAPLHVQHATAAIEEVRLERE